IAGPDEPAPEAALLRGGGDVGARHGGEDRRLPGAVVGVERGDAGFVAAATRRGDEHDPRRLEHGGDAAPAGADLLREGEGREDVSHRPGPSDRSPSGRYTARV